MTDKQTKGRTLHREFVGMLFALAIAEVAVRGAEIVNSDLGFWTKAPALSHLLLAAMVIATSWVGWGWSKHSLSNVSHVFTRDFIELALDVWLVGVYFFLVQGAERILDFGGGRTVNGSLAIEARWVLVMFFTYFVWDVWTKWGQWGRLLQRGWASLTCAGLALWTFGKLGPIVGVGPVLWGDTGLLALVLLFRAMKIRDFSEHTMRTWALVGGLFLLWAVSISLVFRV